MWGNLKTCDKLTVCLTISGSRSAGSTGVASQNPHHWIIQFTFLVKLAVSSFVAFSAFHMFLNLLNWPVVKLVAFLKPAICPTRTAWTALTPFNLNCVDVKLSVRFLISISWIKKGKIRAIGILWYLAQQDVALNILFVERKWNHNLFPTWW